MNKREYLQAMHQTYEAIYSQYGDKEEYTFQEGMRIAQLFLQYFPKAFKINQRRYEAAMPEVIERSKKIVREGMSIDELLMGLSLVALRITGTVTRFFPLRILLWGMGGPLQITPDRFKNR